MNMMKTNVLSCAAVAMIAGIFAPEANANTVKVTMTAMENEVVINNNGDKYPAWTFDGAIPGKVVRVTEGDEVDFTLINPASNKNAHSMDFHAAEVHVLEEFAPVKPGESKHFVFKAKRAGAYMYHCGASAMVEHIARGMYGLIIVDPKKFTKDFPKADREYVLIQSQLFPAGTSVADLLENKGWTNALINGKPFNYDPVHDPKASGTILHAKPGERVRIFYVNANINMPIAAHPIAGIWDRVYANGSPKNVLYDMQTYGLPVASAAAMDIVSPADKATANAIVDHTMSAALRGAITVLINSDDAPADAGKGDNILPR
ncbi:MAG: nitrite reductase [Zetaproteobacteria bacterium CG_4_9_14_3_um_filter_49_83]|nr:MAG: nitrite reductase [Zetaproteobacteria bacterium CG1_02_49_23]PIQ30371.1 MAG: nitrite reductase [Zetaproteobacteria bacterium CG17_big_fil_post_rev_8_21_14_2_50_50_13]PIV29702.1 MAG: nitrite reductase [Zetaproteobacteria bacterium CG02_land_8_20_14_3_00_50_9]PIY54735.1 MAG: nitrite reductase [Zetaproteobacteria bacterium CG_4_10_14_0_8_um_filter_49_80]PJA34123.1 MAG: nitrite reductase [Zetaproteobacteria bacterium CG_4_9_14_3_um_filter_49_83]